MVHPGSRQRNSACAPPAAARGLPACAPCRTGSLSGRPRGRDLGTPRLRVPKPGNPPGNPPARDPCPPSSPGSSRKPPSQPTTLRAQAMVPRRSPAAGSCRGPSGNLYQAARPRPSAPSARSPPGPELRGWPQVKGTVKPVRGYRVVPAPALIPRFLPHLSFFLFSQVDGIRSDPPISASLVLDTFFS